MSYNKDIVIGLLKQIETSILTIKRRTAMILSPDDFFSSSANEEKLDAVCMQLIFIGETVKSIDKITNKELLPKYESVPWSQIMKMRDIIAHHYFDLDVDEVFIVISRELTPLTKGVQYLIEEVSKA